MKRFWLGAVLFILFFGVVFLYSLNGIKESDSFYHLKVGQVIWETGRIPHADIFSYTALGAPWVTHEWLAELLFYGVASAAGLWGLIVLTAAIAVCAYVLLYLAARRRGVRREIILLFTALLGFPTFALWIPRPQIFAFFSFALLIFLLEEYRRGSKRGFLVGALLTILFWANVNASFILGIVVFFWYALAASLSKRFSATMGNTPPPANARKWLFAGTVLAAVVSLLNPNTYRIFFYSTAIQGAATAFNVTEWQPITVFLGDGTVRLFLVEMVLVLVLYVWHFFSKKEGRDIILFGLLGGLSVLPFISVRHIGFWPIAALLPACAAAERGLGESLIRRLGERRVLSFVVIAGAVLFVFRFAWLPRYPINRDYIPEDAVNFIETEQLHGPLFNMYNEGGYLIWRLWPEEKVFVDGRSEVFGPDVRRDFFAITGNFAQADDLVDNKYHINYFFLAYRPESLLLSIAPLVTHLKERGWPLVYWDDTALLYVRPSEDNAKLIERYTIKGVDPFIDPNSIPLDKRKAATEELQKLFERTPRSSVIQAYIRLFLFGRSN